MFVDPTFYCLWPIASLVVRYFLRLMPYFCLGVVKKYLGESKKLLKPIMTLDFLKSKSAKNRLMFGVRSVQETYRRM